MKIQVNKRGLLSLGLMIMVTLLWSAVGQASSIDPNQLLGATNWEGTFVYDQDGKDVTEKNAGFIGRARYDADLGRYEFFDKENNTRGDEGIFFVTPDGRRRILMSTTRNYRVVVDMVRLDSEKFTYRRDGVQDNGSNGNVYVEHVPYDGELTFTNQLTPLNKETGEINTNIPGKAILASTFWTGTIAKDGEGNDVSEYNRGYLGLARYDLESGRYEFFNGETGASRGDYGYFDVIRGNKERTHISLGSNYGATLELTELNASRFTYARNGVDKDNNPIQITVEHEPYTGDFPLEFTFNPSTEAVVMPPIDSTLSKPKSNAIVEVESKTPAGTVRFSEDVSTQASIVFANLDASANQSTLPEKEAQKANISVIDTRVASESGSWNVKTKMDDGQFGRRGFLASKLGIILNPTSTESSIVSSGNVVVTATEKTVFAVNYQAGNPANKTVILNPTLTIDQASRLTSGVYGANLTWTLTPEV